MGLPSPDTLSLSQAIAFVMSRCDCTDGAAKDALRRAGREGRLEAEGMIPLTAHPRPRFPERYPQTCEALTPADWGQQINWEADSIGRYSSVLITLQSIEAWLSQGQRGESPAKAFAPEKSAETAKPLAIDPHLSGTAPSAAVGKQSRKHATRKLKMADYRLRVVEFLRTQRRYPRRDEDHKWASDCDFHRDSLRACRKGCLPDTATKGGPRKTLSDAEIELAIKKLGA
jgi:hypothetical protein